MGDILFRFKFVKLSIIPQHYIHTLRLRQVCRRCRLKKPINKSHSLIFLKQVNGLSNKFWGWGREDDELFMRMVQAGLKVSWLGISFIIILKQSKVYPLSSGWIINAYACVFLGTDVTLCYIPRGCTSHTSRLPRTRVVRWLGEKKGLLCSLVGRGCGVSRWSEEGGWRCVWWWGWYM